MLFLYKGVAVLFANSTWERYVLRDAFTCLILVVEEKRYFLSIFKSNNSNNIYIFKNHIKKMTQINNFNDSK